MSETTQSTADQPSFHASNVIAHPGSTAAGLSAAAAALTVVQTNGIPSTTIGWIGLLGAILAAIAAVLGK